MKKIIPIILMVLVAGFTGCDNSKTVIEESPEQLLLKDWRPESIYKVPITEIQKAKFQL